MLGGYIFNYVHKLSFYTNIFKLDNWSIVMIKILALDIYGTVLCTEDPENSMPSRKGLSRLVERCKEKSIKIISASDANTDIVKNDLEESGIDISIFNNFYCLKGIVKDFLQILQDYKIKPDELFVIGDSNKDIIGAQRIRAKYSRVPEYKDLKDDFDLGKIIL
jgi:phosphoglycolate phosphatase-like HAD superfamily hydrolase